MKTLRNKRGLLGVLLILALCLPLFAVGPSALADTAAANDLPVYTLLHTNDFHGHLETDYKGRGGSAYMAGVVKDIRATEGEENVLLLSAGDVYLGAAPISQLLLGESAIDIYNMLEYDLAIYGNHEFDKGQALLQERTAQSNFPWIGANIVLEGTDWDHPTWSPPYVLLPLGSGDDQVTLGIIGLDTDETPLVTLKGTTEGLVFKDLTETILHYYDEIMSQADAMLVMVHMGTNDSGPFKGLETVAQELIDAGKPVDLMMGGHQHQPLFDPLMVGDTAIVQAGYYGRWLGRCDVTIDPATKSLTLANYELITINNSLPADPDVEARVAYWAEQVAPILQQPVGLTNVDLIRNYNNESNMGNLVTDSMLWKADQYDDDVVNGSVDIAFTNPGGLRADIEIPVGATLPYTLTWGDTFTVLPFGNMLFLMDLTGAQVQELLDQAGSLYKGILQSSGITWYWYNDCNCSTPTVWGAYGVMVNGEPLERDQVYRVVTNDFLAGGQDGWVTFAEGTNRWNTYYDMQEGANDYIAWYNDNVGPLDYEVEGRITELDDVVTILHTNDVHGRWPAGAYYGNPNGMAYLASLIADERAHNPNALLLDAGDNFQGNAFAQYFRNSTPNPIAGGLNLLDYDAFTIGNHEYNFGPTTFATMLGQLDLPILGAANTDDDGSYGFINDNVLDYVNLDVNGRKVSVFGLTVPDIPLYELPTNIPGLTFYEAIPTSEALVPQIRADENPDVLVALTHLGYDVYKGDINCDTELAKAVPGIDVIIGGHSHTKLDPAVMVTSDANPNGTLIAQAQKYALYLGKINVGFLDGEMVLREGYLIPAGEAEADPTLTAYLQPFVDELETYTEQEIGDTLAPLDALEAYTQETNGANLQTDAAVWELAAHGIASDFHLSGAMSNKKVADDASPANPVTLTVGDMYDLMPYENSLVVMEMNGPKIKQILERSYRNWYYYNYVPGWGGYSHYTTCMLDINGGNQIRYVDGYPELPTGDNVYSLRIGDQAVDFDDADTFYNVSTVNYVAAGSCNFNDDGVTLWPLDAIVADTQYYVRDSVIGYIQDVGVINPQIEGRVVMLPYALEYDFVSDKDMVFPPEDQTFTFTATNIGTGTSPEPAQVTFDLPGTLWMPGDPTPVMDANIGEIGWYPGAMQVRWSGYIMPDEPLEINFAVNARGASTVWATLYDGTDFVDTLSWSTAAHVTIQQGVQGYTETYDTYIDLWTPNANYGAWAAMRCRQSNIQKALVKFGGLWNRIPAGAQVTSATLQLNADGRSNTNWQEAKVAPVMTDWDVASVTWNEAAAGVPWTTPGGDYGDAVDVVLVDALGSYAWDVTGILQDWVDGVYGNYGVILYSETQVGAVEYLFNASDPPSPPADGSKYPALIVEYTLP